MSTRQPPNGTQIEVDVTGMDDAERYIKIYEWVEIRREWVESGVRREPLDPVDTTPLPRR